MNFIKSLVPSKKQFYNPVVGHVALLDLTEYKTNNELEETRRILGLTNSAYDFGLQACLVCVNAYPEILKEANTGNLIEFISSYKKPTIVANGTKIIPLFNKFSAEFIPSDIVTNSNLIITYVDDQKVSLSLGENKWVQNYELHRNVLDIDFPEELKSIKFGVEVMGAWTPGSQVSISLVPNSYPFRAVVENLKNRVGLHDSFISFPELTYKIAIATLAVHKEQINLSND